MTLYMAITADEIELPAFVADTPAEMAKFLGRPKGHVLTIITRKTKTNDGYRVERVEIEDE